MITSNEFINLCKGDRIQYKVGEVWFKTKCIEDAFYNVLNNVTVINRFRHKIEPKIAECDERTQQYYKDMCNAIDNLITYTNTIK